MNHYRNKIYFPLSIEKCRTVRN